MSQLDRDDIKSSTEQYRFKNKLDNETYNRLIEKRNQIFVKMGYKIDRTQSCQNVWEQKPVDFSRKLYRPQPPKRNTRDAIKPEQYNRFLRSSADESIFWEKPEEKKKTNELMLESSFISESYENWKRDFETQFRTMDSLEAKIYAARLMSFREGLEMYQNPRDYDFRGIPKHIYGLPEFDTKSEKDPLKIKFKTKNLDKFSGFADSTSFLREFENDHQMGDQVLKKPDNYEPKLILPRLQFPNKYDAYTRFKTNNASADDAYYERLIPALNKKWLQENNQKYQKKETKKLRVTPTNN